MPGLAFELLSNRGGYASYSVIGGGVMRSKQQITMWEGPAVTQVDDDRLTEPICISPTEIALLMDLFDTKRPPRADIDYESRRSGFDSTFEFNHTAD